MMHWVECMKLAFYNFSCTGVELTCLSLQLLSSQWWAYCEKFEQHCKKYILLLDVSTHRKWRQQFNDVMFDEWTSRAGGSRVGGSRAGRRAEIVCLYRMTAVALSSLVSSLIACGERINAANRKMSIQCARYAVWKKRIERNISYCSLMGTSRICHEPRPHTTSASCMFNTCYRKTLSRSCWNKINKRFRIYRRWQKVTLKWVQNGHLSFLS